MNRTQLKNIIEAAIMIVDTPASMDYLLRIFTEDEKIGREEINVALEELAAECETRGVELKQVASGYRYQAKQDLLQWLSRLDIERPSRYSRALLETLSLVVYRQPVTRAEIEDVRGVAVSSSIIKTLLEREWVRVVGHRDVPGKPALYGTTRQFLDYFNLKSLSELPPLAEIRSLDSIQSELELKMGGIAAEGEAANDAAATEGEQPTAEDGAEAASDVDETQVAAVAPTGEPLDAAVDVDVSSTENGTAESSQGETSDVESETAVVEEESRESVAVVAEVTAEPETDVTLIDDEPKDDEGSLAIKVG
ncbi:MAG: SMC-Scp complex subunit ScpB [Thiotrichaceae bacterium]|nr:SMC-Scp complex subunit ScpB [Thiotrichaceae bacterium]PCI12269.1 MAG: SMC-Scp complex subunit ScpB [Thiotrichales bacterium]